MSIKIQTHCDLKVYRKAFDAAMTIFEMTKTFPKEETYSLTDQIRRSSRSPTRAARGQTPLVAKSFLAVTPSPDSLQLRVMRPSLTKAERPLARSEV